METAASSSCSPTTGVENKIVAFLFQVELFTINI